MGGFLLLLRESPEEAEEEVKAAAFEAARDEDLEFMASKGRRRRRPIARVFSSWYRVASTGSF